MRSIVGTRFALSILAWVNVFWTPDAEPEPVSEGSARRVACPIGLDLALACFGWLGRWRQVRVAQADLNAAFPVPPGMFDAVISTLMVVVRSSAPYPAPRPPDPRRDLGGGYIPGVTGAVQGCNTCNEVNSQRVPVAPERRPGYGLSDPE